MIKLAAVALCSLAVYVDAQCTGGDDPSCSGWIQHGFCSNTGVYSMNEIKRYCGVGCGLCNADGTQTAAGGGTVLTPCTDANSNCASWQATGFCTNPTYSNQLKLLYCCGTCRPLLQGATTAATGATTAAAGATTAAAAATTVAG